MMKTAFQMEYLADVDRDSTNSLILMREAEKRGYGVYHYHPQDISLHNGKVIARARPVSLDLTQDNFFTLGSEEMLDLASLDVIHVRQHPPFDMAYITSTYLLERLPGEVLVVNHPAAIRDAPEKLFPFRWPEYMPPTLVSRDQKEIYRFLKKHEQVVVKPLYEYFGYGIFRASDDAEGRKRIETALDDTNVPLMFQRFLPEIAEGNIRVVLFDGEVGGVLRTVPPQNEFLIYRDSQDMVHTLTEREQEICAVIGPELNKKGLIFAGLDMIGGYLTEINVTCTGSLIRLNQIYGVRHETGYWDAIEARLEACK